MEAIPGSVVNKGLRAERWANELDEPPNPGLQSETERSRRNASVGVAIPAEDLSGREIEETITAHFTMRVLGIYCTEGRICEAIRMDSLRVASSEERRRRA